MRLRAVRGEDAASIAAIYAPFVTDGVISFETEPPDAGEIARRIAAGGGLYPWLVALDADDEVAGYAYAGPFRTRLAYRFCVETTVYVTGNMHGRGIGRQLYEALLETLVAQGFTHAVGVIALPNTGSVALHERLGYRHVGTNRRVGWKFGAWHDVGLWQRTLAEPDAPPSEPIPFAELPGYAP